MSKYLCCFNWKVYAGLAAVAVGVWLVAPALAWGALPVLLVLACPLSMLVMMRGMPGGHCATDRAHSPGPAPADLSHAQHLGELRARLDGLAAERTSLAHQITLLESEPVPAVREAEAVASAAMRDAESVASAAERTRPRT